MLKETPKPEMIRLNLSHSFDHEGGSEESNQSHEEIKSKKSNKNSIKKKRKLEDISNIDLNSDEWKSDINLNERNDKDINPGRIFNHNPSLNDLFNQIPDSAFESSNSSDSNSTFESHDGDDMNIVEEPDQLVRASKAK